MSQELFTLRGMAMYGDENAGIPAGDLFDQDNAKETIKKAKYVYSMIEKMKDES
jgi:hypothetical protein